MDFSRFKDESTSPVVGSQLDDSLDEPNAAGHSLDLAESLLYHILLPRHIPDHATDDVADQEDAFLVLMSEAIQHSAEWLPLSTVAMFAAFFNVQRMCTADDICRGINGLRPGRTFAMHVRCQNVVFVCHMPAQSKTNGEPNEETPVIVATFPGRVHASEIYSHPMDLEVSSSSLRQKRL